MAVKLQACAENVSLLCNLYVKNVSGCNLIVLLKSN